MSGWNVALDAGARATVDGLLEGTGCELLFREVTSGGSVSATVNTM